eukprot:SAG11_NODE_37300_length_257_cov_1.202532_1_plen_25_part_10
MHAAGWRGTTLRKLMVKRYPYHFTI